MAWKAYDWQDLNKQILDDIQIGDIVCINEWARGVRVIFSTEHFLMVGAKVKRGIRTYIIEKIAPERHKFYVYGFFMFPGMDEAGAHIKSCEDGFEHPEKGKEMIRYITVEKGV